jgi:hypothetical protein
MSLAHRSRPGLGPLGCLLVTELSHVLSVQLMKGRKRVARAAFPKHLDRRKRFPRHLDLARSEVLAPPGVGRARGA